VRQFQQDDCHVFITEDQIKDEVRFLVQFILAYYETFGLSATVRFATRPEVRIGDDALWDHAESALRAALEATGMAYELKPGDGAFYGPKIDFDVTDSIGRAWQLGTIQLDYNAPERFDLTYTNSAGAEERPVMIHRAILGSLERFIGVLIEHTGGVLPLWLAPEQVRVLSLSEKVEDYAKEIADILKREGFRAHADIRNEKLGFKVREAELAKVPYMVVVGEREAVDRSVSLRLLRGEKNNAMPLAALIEKLKQEPIPA
jgi:threonyl-tRNA synthetase